MLHIAASARDYTLAQAPEAQNEILQTLKKIEGNFLSGQYLPFPWEPGILGYTSPRYFITYRLTTDVPEVTNITRMPTADDIERAFQERRPR